MLQVRAPYGFFDFSRPLITAIGAKKLVAFFLLISSPAIHSQDLRSGTNYEDKRDAGTVTVRTLSIPRTALENYQRGVHELLKHNPAESIPYLSKAIAKYPNYYEAYHNLRIAQERLGKEEQAMDSFRRAIDSSQGKYALAEYAYAMMLCRKGKAEDAELTVRYALELSQYRPSGEVVLGTVLLYLHRSVEAEGHAREALSLEPNLLDAYLVVAGAHDQLSLIHI